MELTTDTVQGSAAGILGPEKMRRCERMNRLLTLFCRISNDWHGSPAEFGVRTVAEWQALIAAENGWMQSDHLVAKALAACAVEVRRTVEDDRLADRPGVQRRWRFRGGIAGGFHRLPPADVAPAVL